MHAVKCTYIVSMQKQFYIENNEYRWKLTVKEGER